MKKIALFVGAILILSFSLLVFAEVKVGVVDVNRVLANVQQIKNIQTDLKKLFDPRGQEIVNLQKSFRVDVERYRQNNTKLQGEDLRKEQQKLIDENNKLRDAQLGFRRDLVAAQNQALHPVLTQIEGIIKKIAQEQKFDLIVTRISTAYNNSQLEITDQVIAEMGKVVVENGQAEMMKANSNVGFIEKARQKIKKIFMHDVR